MTDVDRIAAEAVNLLDWDAIYSAARLRMIRDMTGGFYDEHLAREIAKRLAHFLAEQIASGEEG